MGLESVTYISDLVATNPVGASDQKREGDDHIRNIKAGLLATLPNLTGAMTATHAELNSLAGRQTFIDTTLQAANEAAARAALGISDTVATAAIEDNAVTLAKMASGTDGNIISYDASGDPVAIATGTDGQVLTSTGAGSPPAFEDPAGSCSVVVFTSSGTWTKPANFLYAIIEVQGGGGGGGGTANPGGDEAGAGAGGGGGGYARKMLLAADLGATESVTVGGTAAGGSTSDGTAGNASTFAVASGTDIVGNGGGAGNSAVGAVGVRVEAGAVGGAATGGDINITGSGTGPAFSMGNASWRATDSNLASPGTQALAFSSPGGAGFFGGGGGSSSATETTTATGGAGTHGGGGGGSGAGDGGGAVTGGAGGAGLVVVTEYLST